MKECAGAVGTLADKRSEGPQMDEILKLCWLCCTRKACAKHHYDGKSRR